MATYSNEIERGSEAVPGYTLIEELGEGAIGKVWKATGPGGIECALKFVDLSSKSGFKEFKTLHRIKKIKHPNLIPLNAFFVKDSDGEILRFDENTETAELEGLAAELILIMGLGEKTLEGRLKECRAQGERGIPIKELMVYMDDSASGIDFLNVEQGIQHCDIKPHNVLIVSRRAQVCDYGLARVLGGGGATKVLGTPFYQAPELAMDGAPSEATDQYSLALSYIQLRTGKLPFVAESPLEMMLIHVEGKYDFSRLPDPERVVIKKALARKPRDRFPTVSDMVQALKTAASGNAPTASSHPKSQAYVSDPSIPRGLKPNAEIVPGYYLQRRIGKGGYGEVWSARAPGGKDVAIKVVSKLKATHQQQEFKALELMKRLEHDGLLELESYWLLDKEFYPIPDNLRGQPGCPTAEHLVMITKLAKKNLLQRLDEYKQSGQRGIPVRELIAHMRLIADALDYLNTPQHEMDGKTVAIMHRDIKPENILLMGNNKVKVSDFGLAKALEGTDAAKIGEQSVGYTPAYAAPELFKNEVHSTTDQYSLGIMYYKLRTGKFPFDPDARNLMMIHIRGELDLTDLPEPERQVVARATALRPSERYQTCLDMVRDLLKACGFVSSDSFDLGSSQADINPLSGSKVPGLTNKRPDAPQGTGRGKSLRPEELEDRGLLRATQGEIDLDKGTGLSRSGTDRKPVYESSEEWSSLHKPETGTDSRRGAQSTKPNDSRRSGPRQDTPPDARSSGTSTPRSDAKVTGRFAPKPPADHTPEAPQGTIGFQPDGYNEPAGHGRVDVDLDSKPTGGRSSGNYANVRTSGRFSAVGASSDKARRPGIQEGMVFPENDDPLAAPEGWNPERKSGSSLAGVLVAGLLLIVVAGGGFAGYLYWQSTVTPPTSIASVTRPVPSTDAPKIVPATPSDPGKKPSTGPTPPTPPETTPPMPDQLLEKLQVVKGLLEKGDWKDALQKYKTAQFPASVSDVSLAGELTAARKKLIDQLLDVTDKQPLAASDFVAARDGLLEFHKANVEKTYVQDRLVKAADKAVRADLKTRIADVKLIKDTDALKALPAPWVHVARAEAFSAGESASKPDFDKEMAWLDKVPPTDEVVKFANYLRATALLASNQSEQLGDIAKLLESAFATPLPELSFAKRITATIRPAFTATMKYAQRAYIDPFDPVFDEDEAKFAVAKIIVPLAARLDTDHKQAQLAYAFLSSQLKNDTELTKIIAKLGPQQFGDTDYTSVQYNLLRYPSATTDKDKIEITLQMADAIGNYESENNGGSFVRSLTVRFLESVLDKTYDLIKTKTANSMTPELAIKAARIAYEKGVRTEILKTSSQKELEDFKNYIKCYSLALDLDLRSPDRARYFAKRASNRFQLFRKENTVKQKWAELTADVSEAMKADPASPEPYYLDSTLKLWEFILGISGAPFSDASLLQKAEQSLVTGIEKCGTNIRYRETKELLASHSISVYTYLRKYDVANSQSHLKKLLNQLDKAVGSIQTSSVGILINKGKALENLILNGEETGKSYKDVIALFDELTNRCQREYSKYNQKKDVLSKLNAAEWLDSKLLAEINAARVRYLAFEWGKDSAIREKLLSESNVIYERVLGDNSAQLKSNSQAYDEARYFLAMTRYRLSKYNEAEKTLNEQWTVPDFQKKSGREKIFVLLDFAREQAQLKANAQRIEQTIKKARDAYEAVKSGLKEHEIMYIDAMIAFLEEDTAKALQILNPVYAPGVALTPMVVECQMLGWLLGKENATVQNAESASARVDSIEQTPHLFPAPTQATAFGVTGILYAELASKAEGEIKKGYEEKAKKMLQKALDVKLTNDVRSKLWSAGLKKVS